MWSLFDRIRYCKNWLLCFNGAWYSRHLMGCRSVEFVKTCNQKPTQQIQSDQSIVKNKHGQDYPWLWTSLWFYLTNSICAPIHQQKIEVQSAVNSSILWIPNQHSLLWIWNGTTQSNNVIMQGLPPKNSLTCSSLKQGQHFHLVTCPALYINSRIKMIHPWSLSMIVASPSSPWRARAMRHQTPSPPWNELREYLPQHVLSVQIQQSELHPVWANLKLSASIQRSSTHFQKCMEFLLICHLVQIALTS